jgi:hypothetical protein
MSNDIFDPVAVVVDWLDACRMRRLSDLLDLYDAKASFRCACEGLYVGREELTRYWSTRLEERSRTPSVLLILFPTMTASSPASRSNMWLTMASQFTSAFSSQRLEKLQRQPADVVGKWPSVLWCLRSAEFC